MSEGTHVGATADKCKDDITAEGAGTATKMELGGVVELVVAVVVEVVLE